MEGKGEEDRKGKLARERRWKEEEGNNRTEKTLPLMAAVREKDRIGAGQGVCITGKIITCKRRVKKM